MAKYLWENIDLIYILQFWPEEEDEEEGEMVSNKLPAIKSPALDVLQVKTV